MSIDNVNDNENPHNESTEELWPAAGISTSATSMNTQNTSSNEIELETLSRANTRLNLNQTGSSSNANSPVTVDAPRSIRFAETKDTNDDQKDTSSERRRPSGWAKAKAAFKLNQNLARMRRKVREENVFKSEDLDNNSPVHSPLATPRPDTDLKQTPSGIIDVYIYIYIYIYFFFFFFFFIYFFFLDLFCLFYCLFIVYLFFLFLFFFFFFFFFFFDDK